MCECLRVQKCVHGFTPLWGAGMSLCTHPPSQPWHLGWLRWVLALPSHPPSILDLPGSLLQMTPAYGVAVGTGPSRASGAEGTCGSQQPPSLILPSRDSDAPGAVRGAQPRTPGSAGAPDPHGAQLSAPRIVEQPWLLLLESGCCTRQPPCPIPPHRPDTGQRQGKSRCYWAAGCSPCLGHGPWPEISWRSQHSSLTLGFLFSAKERGKLAGGAASP